MKGPLIILILILNLSCGKGQTTISKEQALNDFLYLREKIEEIHPDRFFFRTAQQEDSLYQVLSNRIDKKLYIYDFYDIVAEYTTFFKDGHTFPSMEFLTNGYQYSLENSNSILPFQFDFKEDYLFVSGVFDENLTHIIGSKFLQLNGNKTEQILANFQKFYAKKTHHIDNAHVRMFNEYFWRTYGSFSEWTIEYLDKEGNTKMQTFEGLNKMSKVIKNKASSNGIRMEPYTFKYVFGDQAGLLTINFMANPKEFESFAATVFEELHENKTKFLIIDMRNNGGGSSQVGDILYSFLSDAPYLEGKMLFKTSQPIKDWYQEERQEHPLYDFVMRGEVNELVPYPDTSKVTPTPRKYPFEGKSFLLTSKKTYSSGHMFAGIYKCGNIGTIVGQETGQATKTPGDAFGFTLPYSKIGISVSYKIFEGPCELSFKSGFKPHYPLSYSQEELKEGIDKELLFIEKLIREN